MSRAELDRLVKLRGYKRQKLTRLCNEIEVQLSSLISLTRDAYICRLLQIRADLDKFNDDILSLYIELNFDDITVDNRISECDQYVASILDLLTRLNLAIVYEPNRPIPAPSNPHSDGFARTQLSAACLRCYCISKDNCDCISLSDMSESSVAAATEIVVEDEVHDTGTPVNDSCVHEAAPQFMEHGNMRNKECCSNHLRR